MFRLEYPFFTQNLKFATPKELSDRRTQKLDELISKYLATAFRNMSSRVPESYIARLNNSDLEYPVKLPPPIWEFLNTNLKAHESTGANLSPFETETGIGVTLPVDEFWSVDHQNQTVIRLADIRLNSNLLLAAFVLDKLAALISDFGLNEFLLSAHNIAIARGGNDWAIEFTTEEDNLEIIANNVAAAMEIPYSPKASDEVEARRNPFADTEQLSSWKIIVAETDSAVGARLASRMATKVGYLFQFPEFASKWNSGLTIIDHNDVAHQFQS